MRISTSARSRRWVVRGLASVALAGLALVTDGAAAGPSSPATTVAATQPLALAGALEEVDAALARWDLKAADQVLARAGSGAAVQVKRGVLEVFRADYSKAEELLAVALSSGELEAGSAAEQEARHYLGLARGAQKALAGATTVASDDGTVVAVFADPKDAIIAPYLFDAMAQARTAVGDLIGVVPDHPVRFEFLDNPANLALVTPLTVQNIRTTGTVGVTKYRRIMMITPRVMLFGYGWLDTAVHEYVHYLLTMRTANQAPVWLQEGLAKLLEARWRRPDPEPLEAGIAYRLHQAIDKDDLVTLAEMYPSVAMLPSAERAALAYAEVETMLGLLHERKGAAGLATLLDAVADGRPAEDALAAAWGSTFEGFMQEWKRETKKRTARGVDEELDRIVFKDGESDAPPEELGDVFSHLGGGKARQHARLGGLLQSRGHDQAAAMQYEKARKADARARRDPALSRRLGRLYVELGEFAKAAPLLDRAAEGDPEDANLAAAQARAKLRIGDVPEARAALRRAVRNNPFIPSIHCDLAELAPDEQTRLREQAQCTE